MRKKKEKDWSTPIRHDLQQKEKKKKKQPFKREAFLKVSDRKKKRERPCL